MASNQGQESREEDDVVFQFACSATRFGSSMIGQSRAHHSSRGATSTDPVIVPDDQDMTIVISDDEDYMRPTTQEGTPQEQAISPVATTEGDLLQEGAFSQERDLSDPTTTEGAVPGEQDVLPSDAMGTFPQSHDVPSPTRGIGEDSYNEFHPFNNSSDEDDTLPPVSRLKNGKKPARAHSSPAIDSPRPSTRRRRGVVTPSSSSSAPVSAVNSTLPAPRWATGWMNDNFLTQLKAIYERDPAAFYSHINQHYQDYLRMRERHRFDNYSEWIISKFGESRCLVRFRQAGHCPTAACPHRAGGEKPHLQLGFLH
ncbi:hypothetical protein FSOLCH5_003940 [Fusarium solani]